MRPENWHPNNLPSDVLMACHLDNIKWKHFLFLSNGAGWCFCIFVSLYLSSFRPFLSVFSSSSFLFFFFWTQYRETEEHFVKCVLDVIASTHNPSQGDLDLNLKE